MPRTYKRQPGSRNYRNYTEETLTLCLNAVRSGSLTQRKAEEQFKIPRRTIINKLKNHHTNNNPGHPPIFSDEEEAAFAACILSFSDFGFPLDAFDLRMIVKTYLTRIGRTVRLFNKNLPGKEWVQGFLKRHPELTMRFASNIKRVRAAITAESLKEYIHNLSQVVDGIPPENIWNCDETNLTDNPGQKKVIVKRGTKYPEKIRNSSKSSISVMFAGNAAGELLPPYTVYRSTCLWSTWIENGPKGGRYSNSSSGWFDATTFNDWFESLMLPRMKKQLGRKVLICDNLSSHISVHILKLCEQNNISFVCLPPNSTHLTQPLDVAFFRPMKIAWRKILADWKESPDGIKNSVLPKQCFPLLLKKLIDVLDENRADNLIAGFRKCGIYPINVTELLAVIPSYEYNKDIVESSFLEALATKRNDITEMKQRKRRKMTVTAGKSIGPEVLQEITNTSASTANDGHGQEANGEDSDISSGKISYRDDSDNDDNYFAEIEQEQKEEREFDSIITGKKSAVDLLPLTDIVKEVGQHVVFTYENKHFPGKIIDFDENGATISSMQKSLKSWKWPDKADILYYKWDEILGCIKPPKKISKRNYYSVPELGLLCYQ